jgi:hypothetical protein
VSNAEHQEAKLEVELPLFGFQRSMYFNRFRVDRQSDFCLVEFGLLAASGLLSSFSCVISPVALMNNRDSLLAYLDRIGRPTTSVPMWIGAPLGNDPQVVDILTMAAHSTEAETCLFLFSHSSARRLGSGKPLPAQALVILRSSVELQKHLVEQLY